MAKKQTASFTEKHFKSPKFWMTVNFISTISLSIAIMISLIVGGYRTQYLFFPIIFIITDILFLTVSASSNFRFKYSVIIPILYAAVSLALTVLTVITYSVIGTRLFTHVAIFAFVLLHFAAAVAWLLSYLHAGAPAAKRFGTRLRAAFLGLFLIAACCVYGISVFYVGWFGQGALNVERAVEYTLNEETGMLDVTGLASDRGDTVVIPGSFNGTPVGKIDCSFAKDKSIKHVYFESEKLTADSFISPESLFSEEGERTLHGKILEDKSMPLQAALLELARTRDDSVFLQIASITVPHGLSEDQIYVNFEYGFDDLDITDGNFLFLWIGNKGDSVPSSILSDFPYLRYKYNPDDPNNEANLVWAYDNADKHIFTGIDAGSFPGFDQPINESYRGVKFNFEPLIKLTVEDDNDTVYTMKESFVYHDAENKIPHVFTRSQIDAWFAGADKREGFDLSWKLKRSDSNVKKPLDTTATLSSQIDDGSALYPVWTMKAPDISDIFATPDVVYGERADFTSSVNAASSDFLLSYEWKFGGEVKSAGSGFSLDNVLFSDAGFYTLKVTSHNPAITSLTATDVASVSMNVTKRALTLDWVLPENPVYTASAKRVSWSVSSGVSEGVGVINGDNVNLTSYYSDITNAGDYSFAPALSDEAAAFYYIKNNPTNSFTVTPAPLNITWGSNSLIYNARTQTPSATAAGLGNDGAIPLTLTGAIRNTGDSIARASITDTNYTLVNDSYSFSVIPYTVNVVWTNLTHVYDGAAYLPTASATGLSDDGVITFAVSGDGTDVGSYDAEVSLDTTGNYAASEATDTSTYTITKRPLTINWTVPSVVEYTGCTWNYTAAAHNLVEGEQVSMVYTYTGTASADTAPINAGSYEVSVSLNAGDSKNDNYTLTGELSLPVTVTKVRLNLTWTGDGQTYDTAEKQVRISNLGISSQLLIDEATSLLECSGDKNTLAGDYVATASLTSEENFVIESGASYGYEILKRTVSPVWNKAEAAGFVYDGQAKSVYVTLEGIHDSHNTSDVISYVNQTNTDAGENYVATISIINTNYKFADGAETSLGYSIAKRTLNVSWALEAPHSLVYDGAARVWVPTYSGEVSGEAPSISFIYCTPENTESIPAPSDAGSYKLVASLVSSNGINKNYKLSGNTHTYSITPRPVEVSWGNTEFIYSGEAQKPTASYTNTFGNPVTLTVSGEKTDARAAAYTATATNNDSNYTLTNPEIGFTISAKEVAAVWGNTEFIYSGKAQKPEASYVDVFGQPIALTVSGEKINASGTPYTATAACLDTNYTLTNVSASFTVSPKPVSLEWSSLTFIYDGTAHKPTAKFKNVENAYVNVDVNGEKINASNTPYTASAFCPNGNYLLTNPTEEFTVAPRPVNVIWGNTALTYNGKAQKPEASYTDVFGEPVTLEVSGEVTDARAAAYTATAISGDSNYTLENPETDFTVSPMRVTVSWGNTVFIYNGEAHKPTATFRNVSNLPVMLTVEGEQTNASETPYTACTSVSDANYTLENPETDFTVSPMRVTVSWGNTSFTYNGFEQKPTASYTDVESTVTALTVSGGKTNASSAAYTATAICTDSNYRLTNPTVSFRINPLEVTAIWENTSLIYNGEAQKPTASYTDVFGDTATLTVSGEKTNVGASAYTATATTTDSNYTLTGASAEFTISPKTVTVIWENTSLIYNGKAQKPTASYTDVFGEPVTLTVSGEKTNVGASAYTATATAADSNYTLTGASAEFTISPKTVSVIWENTSLIYNGEAQKPTASFTDALGDKIELTVSGAGTNASLTPYSATTSYEDANYLLINTEVGFTVSPLEVTVSWSFDSVEYNGLIRKPEAAVSYTEGGTVAFASPAVTLIAGDGTSIGTHSVMASLDENFSITGGATHTYTITAINVTVSWSIENGIPVPSVSGAPTEAYRVTYYIIREQTPEEYTNSFYEAGDYRVTVTVSDSIYAFASGTVTEKTFTVFPPADGE